MTRPHRILLALGALLAVAGLAAMPVLAADHAVSIVEKRFEPANFTIAAGDKVVWTVSRPIGEPHSVTSGAPNAPDGTFDSGIGLEDQGQTFEFTFKTEGEYSYFCVVHPTDMFGTITVTAAGSGGVSEGAGIPPERRLIAGGILVVTLIVLFGASAVWRRMNPA